MKKRVSIERFVVKFTNFSRCFFSYIEINGLYAESWRRFSMAFRADGLSSQVGEERMSSNNVLSIIPINSSRGWFYFGVLLAALVIHAGGYFFSSNF